MLSVVRLLGGDGARAVPQWTGIELQGSLTQRDGATNPATRKIGDLTLCDAKGERAILVIGNHQLKGKRVMLKKPLAGAFVDVVFFFRAPALSLSLRLFVFFCLFVSRSTHPSLLSSSLAHSLTHTLSLSLSLSLYCPREK